MQPPRTAGRTRKPRVFYGWWIVAAAIVGMSTAPSQFAFGSLGLFIGPLSAEFGWNRAEISAALTVFTVSLAICLPLVGRLADRVGPRRVVLPAMVVCGLALAAMPLVQELWQLWLVFLIIGSLGAGANNLPYMQTISAWFDRRRGLAIGLVMAGAGLGFSYVPPLVQFLIDSRGWRSAYLALAGITLGLAVPVVALVFRDRPADKGLSPDGAPAPATAARSRLAGGLPLASALRRREFWLLWAAFCGLSFSLYGLLPHFVPLLSDRGMPATEAAWAASAIGVTIIASRVLIGWLIDHFFAPRVALLFFLLSAAGLGLLALGTAGPVAWLIAVLIGLSIGAEIDLLAYLSGRYFGLAHFGSVYGFMFAALLVGTSLGPLSFGAVFELSGSYLPVLVFCALLNIVASLLMLWLPRYPEFTTDA